MTNAIEDFRRLGFLNTHSEDIGQSIIKEDSRVVAYCSSDKCMNEQIKRHNYRSKNGVIKPEIERETSRCPDCGHFVRWSISKR